MISLPDARNANTNFMFLAGKYDLTKQINLCTHKNERKVWIYWTTIRVEISSSQF